MAHGGEYTKWNSRLGIFYWLFPAAFVILWASLGYRQIVMRDFYVNRGERQSMRRVIEPAARGDIFDRNGKLLVTNKAAYSAVVYFNDIRKEVGVEYSKIKNREVARLKQEGREVAGNINYGKILSLARNRVLNSYVDRINSILGTNYELSRGDYDRHFYQNRLLPFPIIRNLNSREYAILAEKLPVDSPIQIYTDTARYYPYADIAAHALGYASASKDDLDISNIPGEKLRTYRQEGLVGRTGIERAFDDLISGENGVRIWVVDHEGFQYEVVMEKTPIKGRDVRTTLDIDLQQTIEDSFGEHKGAAVVVDVKTGEVLAMCSRPSYDPNLLSPEFTKKVDMEIRERGAWLNRATQGLYPPGSTFKTLTAIAAFKSNTISPNTLKECLGLYPIGRRNFPCAKRSGHGVLNLEQALAYSCNIYFYQVGLDMGIEPLAQTARQFGLDSGTGIEIGDSTRTLVPDPEYKKRRGLGKWLGGDTANVSIGQGALLQTPLQMACYAASFAAGRTRTRASIVYNPLRPTDLAYHGAEPMPISQVQYNAIKRGMIAAVNIGTCRRAAIKGIQVAAKSGSAQAPVNGQMQTMAWMIAFAPADNPKIAMSVVVEGEKRGDVGGGKTAGPIVHAAMEKYFGVAPASEESVR